MDLEIKLEDLRKIANAIIDHAINDLDVVSIKIDKDFYWNIPEDRRYDMGEKPNELDIGQLSEDWAVLSKILDDKDLAVTYTLTHLGPLLRYIGERIGQ